MEFMGFGAVQVDESMAAEDMQGPSSTVNQRAGNTLASSAARSLLVLWFAAIALYWFLGWLFRKQR